MHKKDLNISYAGITVENIPGTKNYYEIVWNCGGLSAAMSALNHEKAGKNSLEFVTKILESIRKNHKQIIFVTDENMYQNSKDIIDALFKDIFGPENFRILGVKVTKHEKNPINGLQVNRTSFTHENDVVKAIAELPNATVLSSIPNSDPKVTEISKQIQDFRDTIAGMSFQLLELNSRKSNQLPISAEQIGFLEMAHSMEELRDIFERHKDIPLVLKDDYGTAGGTSVNFVGNEAQRKKVLENTDINFPVLVNRFFEPTTVIHKNSGEQFPVQFRPFLGSDGEFLGGSIKFPETPIGKEIFSEGNGKKAFQKQNNALNTSSGKTRSIFIDEKGNVPFGFVPAEKRFEILDGKESEEFLEQFQFANSKNGLSLAETILEKSEVILPELKRVQEETNKILTQIS